MERMCVCFLVVSMSVCVTVCVYLNVRNHNVWVYGRDVGTAASGVFFLRVHTIGSRLYTVPPWKKHARNQPAETPRHKWRHTVRHEMTRHNTTWPGVSLWTQTAQWGDDGLTWCQLVVDTLLGCTAGTHNCFQSKCAPRWLDWVQ